MQSKLPYQPVWSAITCSAPFVFVASSADSLWLIVSSNGGPAAIGPDGSESKRRTRAGPKTTAFLGQSSNARLHDITAWGMNWHNSCVWKVTRLRRDWFGLLLRGLQPSVKGVVWTESGWCVCARGANSLIEQTAGNFPKPPECS